MEELKSSLREELKDLLDNAQEKRDLRKSDISEELELMLPDLQSMDQFPELSVNQKKQFFYNVKPHIESIPDMLSKGATKRDIAGALGVSYRNLLVMEKTIPELSEIFQLADIELIEQAEASMRYLSQPRVIQKQELDRYGNVVTMQDYKEPEFRAVSFILSRRDPRYSDKKVIEHKATVSEDLQNILDQMSPAELEEISRAAEEEEKRANAIEAEVKVHG